MDWLKDNGQPITTNDRPQTIEYCDSIGWSRVNGDKGSGKPGSRKWHISVILGMASKEEVAQYLKEIKLDVDLSGNLNKVKKEAVTKLRGKSNDDSYTNN